MTSELLVGERLPACCRMRVRDADLADVVEHPGEPDPLDPLLGKAELARPSSPQ